MNIDFWKPNKKGTGWAALMNYSEDNSAVYLKMMPQKGTEMRSFDKDNSLVVKMNLNDIGEFLAVIRGSQTSAGGLNDDGKPRGLVHQSQNGDTTSIRFYQADQRPGNILSISRGDKNSFIGFTLGESETLRVFLERSAERIMATPYQPQNSDGGSSEQKTKSSSTRGRKKAVKQEEPEQDEVEIEVPF